MKKAQKPTKISSATPVETIKYHFNFQSILMGLKSLRFITGAVLLPIVVLAILYLPIKILMGLSAVVFAIAAIEWVSLMLIESKVMKIVAFELMLILAAAYVYFDIPVIYILWLAGCWWLFASIAIFLYPRYKKFWESNIVSFFVGFLLLMSTWGALNYLQFLQNYGPRWVLFVLFIVWSCDIGSLFAGKIYGKHKLAQNVSPGKTIEGVCGGLVAVVATTIIFSTLIIKDANFFILLGLALVTAIFSIIGDLQESLFKRVKGVKDSGKLVPGHGGLLDRIDSLLAALPIFTLIVFILISIYQ